MRSSLRTGCTLKRLGVLPVVKGLETEEADFSFIKKKRRGQLGKLKIIKTSLNGLKNGVRKMHLRI
jgi:hypothetical protein